MNNLHKIQPDLPTWVIKVIEHWAPWQNNYPLTYKRSTNELFWMNRNTRNWAAWLTEIKRNHITNADLYPKQKFSYDLVTIID